MSPRLEVLALKTKYPQGGERQLIYATTGRAINSAMLPADAGCVVDNVATLDKHLSGCGRRKTFYGTCRNSQRRCSE